MKEVSVEHILDTGELESHERAVERLLAELKLPPNDLFRTHAETVAEAYRRRGEQIAYDASAAARSRDGGSDG